MYYDPGPDKTTKLLRIAERALQALIAVMGLVLLGVIVGVAFAICAR